MAKDNPYVGKIGHSGVQIVKVPQSGEKKTNSKVRTGSDLRTGK